MIIRKCERCGKEFETHPYRIAQGKARFCSRKCRFEGHLIKVKCQQCGKEFKKSKSAIEDGKGKFCSRECQYKSVREIKTCKVCGKEFEIVKSQRYNNPKVKNPAQFCSRECRAKYFSGERHPTYNDKLLTCKVCGKEFTRKNWTINQRKKLGHNPDFCSHLCSEKYHVMEKNPFWKGGISFEPYCPKFNNEFKERVRIFFGRKCVECGKTEEENGRKLDVHHINYDKMVCCNGNIPLFIALCQSHNASANKDRSNWEQHYTDIINTKYGGKCYLTKEEYTQSIAQPQ